MSRSNPTAKEKIESPVEWYLEFKSDEGKGYFEGYENNESFYLTQDNKFFVLDDSLFRLGGFNKKEQLFMSSRVARSTKEILAVRTKPGKDKRSQVVEYVSWADEGQRNKAKEKGIKYIKCIYVMDVKTRKICRLELKGSTVNAWIDSVSQAGLVRSDFEKTPIAVWIKEIQTKKNGATSYSYPIFEFKKIDVSTPKGQLIDEATIEADKKLQAYLDSILDAQPEQEHQDFEEEEASEIPEMSHEAKQAYERATGRPHVSSFATTAKDDDDDLPF